MKDRSVGLRMLTALVACSVAIGVAATSAVYALAAGSSAAGHVPPRQAARAIDAAPSRVANARSASNTGPWWYISKTITVGGAQTTIATLSLPAGTYQLSASGSIWVSSGKGVQTAGCHLIVGNSSYGDAYVSLDGSSTNQQAFAIVNVLTFKSQTTAQIECLTGKTPVDQLATQVNFIATKA
jgi:hypothetical protein